jgi:hypothetical protein
LAHGDPDDNGDGVHVFFTVPAALWLKSVGGFAGRLQ